MKLNSFVESILPAGAVDTYRTMQEVAKAAADLAVSEPEAAALPALCPPARVTIDIGAGEGAYSWLLRKNSLGLHVFEADPVAARRLTRAFALLPRVVVHMAIAAERESFIERPAGLSPLPQTGGLGESIRAKRTRTTRIDSIKDLTPVGFIRLNCPGWELEALKGAIAVLEQSQPNLLVCAVEEPSRLAAIVAYLAPLGYRAGTIDAGAFAAIDAAGADPVPKRILFLSPRQAPALDAGRPRWAVLRARAGLLMGREAS